MLKLLEKKVVYLEQNYFYPTSSELRGKVLEIGFGDGESLNHYSRNCQIFAVEKSDKKIQQLNLKYPNIKFFKAKAENLPFENNFFDAVVASKVLCSVESLSEAIEEIERVLKLDGRLILIEHISSENKVIRLFQDILSTLTILTDNNCHLYRNSLLTIRKTFNVINEIQIPYFLGTKLIFAEAYNKLGV